MKNTDYKFVTIANGRSDITLHEPIYKGLKKKGEPTPPEPGPEPDPDVVRLIEKYFPDPNFRAALTDALGINEGDEIKPGEYYLYEGAELNVSNHSIDNLEGIQYIAASDCTINCSNNNLTSLDLSSPLFLPLTGCMCQCNKITHLVFYSSSDIGYYYTSIRCYENQIKGEEMDALIESLTNMSGDIRNGGIVIINTASENEGNVCTKTQVQALKNKGWKAYDYNGGSLVEYEGSDPE